MPLLPARTGLCFNCSPEFLCMAAPSSLYPAFVTDMTSTPTTIKPRSFDSGALACMKGSSTVAGREPFISASAPLSKGPRLPVCLRRCHVRYECGVERGWSWHAQTFEGAIETEACARWQYRHVRHRRQGQDEGCSLQCYALQPVICPSLRWPCTAMAYAVHVRYSHLAVSSSFPDAQTRCI